MTANKKWQRANNRKESSRYFAIPRTVLLSSNYINLSPYAVKLLIDLGEQYYGSNNGDLCATWSMMKKRGWRSPETLNNSIKELLHYGMIVKSRQGGRNSASLYAITWRSVDSCNGKLNISETNAPLALWMNDVPKMKRGKTDR